MACLVLRKSSDWWYGRYRIDGKEYVKNLRVGIRGKRPDGLLETGSVQFENSRGEAQNALENLLETVASGKSTEELAQAVYQARTGGRRVKTYLVDDLQNIWRDMPRKRTSSNKHQDLCLSWLKVFMVYAATNFPTVKKIDHLSSHQAKAYLKYQEERGIAAKTYNDILWVLKAVFRRAGSNVFDEFKSMPVETINRKPYSPDELKAVFEAAESDEFIRPIIITAACTAMRRGDCCLLKWDSVDLEEGYVTVKTSKTGATIDVPLFPMLFNEIATRQGNRSEYVFPEQAKQYQTNPGMLTDRLRKVLALAGFRDHDAKTIRVIDNFDPAKLKRKVKAHIKTIRTERKRDRMQRLFDAYASGLRMCKAAEVAETSLSTASGHLNELEAATGIAFIRGKPRKNEGHLPPKRGDVHAERETGLLQASIRDFHSFRTTWVTIALSGGIPFELVQKVTGHATASVVMKHYFKPHRAQLKKAIRSSMPNLLTDGTVTPVERAAEILHSANSRNWRASIDQALEILEKTS